MTYDPDDPGPVPNSTPPCPICPADQPHQVTPLRGGVGGYLCDGCGFVLTPEATGDNKRRRDMWVDEVKPRNTDAPRDAATSGELADDLTRRCRRG